MGEQPHQPVLLEETLEWLDPQPGGRFLDLTLGCGGHARGLLRLAGPSGFVCGIDRDRELLDDTVSRLREEGYGEERFRAVAGDFADIDVLLGASGLVGYDGVIADLGACSVHFDRPERGFSFRESGPLDMRYDRSSGMNLSDFLEVTDQRRLERILREYGEERFSRRVARAIIEARDAQRLDDTLSLAETVRRAYPARARYSGRIDPATRTFQALRIAVNCELESVRSGLVKALDGMRVGSRLAVISFHSLEDRITKRLFRSISKGRKDFYGSRGPAAAQEMFRKPVVAGEAEIGRNPRSRSAKLRVVEKRIEGLIVAMSECPEA